MAEGEASTAPAVRPMAGVLHRYGPLPHQLAFISSDTANAANVANAPAHPQNPTRHAVLLSGLTEGLLALPYAPLLAERCARMHPPVALVQAQLRSSYDGWGSAALDGDADELLLLLAWLRREQRSVGVVLVGHSTGCQIVCRFCERHDAALSAAAAAAAAAVTAATAAAPGHHHHQQRQQQQPPLPPLPPPPLLGVCMQAPVSDREYFFAADPQGSASKLAAARAARDDGDPERLIAVVEGSPLTARRASALLERLGDDDMFSRDLTDEEMRARTSVGWVGGGRGAAGLDPRRAPERDVLVLASGADEYALPLLPEGEEGKDAAAASEAKLALIRGDAERVARAVGGGRAEARTIAGAPHNGGSCGRERKEVADAIAGLVSRAFARL